MLALAIAVLQATSYHMQAQANGHADTHQTTRLHVGHLTRNVNEGHIKEIFSTFGTITSVELSIDKVSAEGRSYRRCCWSSFTFLHGMEEDGESL